MTDDLISRQAAVDALEREKTYCTAFREGYTQTNVFEKYNAGLSDGIKALKNLPSAQPEHRWIPCSERLPDTNGDYIVTGRQGAVNKRKYEDGRWYGNWAVIAWMPLPAPWKGEADGKH